jgi:hypothetical protein
LGKTWGEAYRPLGDDLVFEVGHERSRSYLYQPIRRHARPLAVAVSALSPVATGLTGFYLWRNSDRLASSIFPSVREVEGSGAEDQERLLTLALSLTGIWLVSEAIPTLVFNISLSILNLVPAQRSVFGPIYQTPVMSVTAKANTIAALVRAFIGFGLVVGSERLAKVISGMRGRHSLK